MIGNIGTGNKKHIPDNFNDYLQVKNINSRFSGTGGSNFNS